MNAKKLVALSNQIGIVSIFLLVYWVFIFVSMQVFGLRVFRENMTETFYLSIMGILALMLGALIINVMMNLTRIAQKHNADEVVEKKRPKALVIGFIVSFPLIIGILFAGDFMTSMKKEKMLINSAKSIVELSSPNTQILADYKFDKKWIIQTADVLKLMSKTDSNFRSVFIITKDKIGTADVFLRFGENYYFNANLEPSKVDFVCETSREQRNYLKKVFEANDLKPLFRASKGNYELFYPIKLNGKIIVLYFTDSQSYGKLGS